MGIRVAHKPRREVLLWILKAGVVPLCQMPASSGSSLNRSWSLFVLFIILIQHRRVRFSRWQTWCSRMPTENGECSMQYSVWFVLFPNFVGCASTYRKRRMRCGPDGFLDKRSARDLHFNWPCTSVPAVALGTATVARHHIPSLAKNSVVCVVSGFD